MAMLSCVRSLINVKLPVKKRRRVRKMEENGVKKEGQREEMRQGKKAKPMTVKFNQLLVFGFVSSSNNFDLVIEEAQ